MASDSQRSIVFMPYDPLAAKAKRKARASTLTAMSSFSKSNAQLVAEDSAMDEISPLSEETEQQQICSPESPVQILHSKESSTSNLHQHSVARLEELGDTASVPQGSHQDVDDDPASDSGGGEGSLDAADTQLVVKDSIEVFPSPLQTDSNADYSLAGVVDRLQRRKRARSPSADADSPLMGAPRQYSTQARSGKRKRPSRNDWRGAPFTTSSKSPSPYQGNQHPQIFPRGMEDQDDSDVHSSRSSDREGRPGPKSKRRLSQDRVAIPCTRVEDYSTTEASEIEERAKENDRADSDVVKGSKVSSNLSYRRSSDVLSAAPQRCRRASIETPCQSQKSHRVKHSSTAPRKKHLNSDKIEMKATRASTQTDRRLHRQRRTPSAGAVTSCGPNAKYKANRDLFEISGLSSLSRPDSDVVVAHLRAIEPHPLTTASIPGLEAFGAGYQTLHWIQRTQESWLLIGFRDRTPAPLFHTGRTTNLPDLNSGSYMSQHNTGHESGIAADSSDEKTEQTADYTRGLSSREPWKESDDYRLLSYKDKEDMPWDEIFKRFPDRSAGAVRTHYHNLLKHKTAYRRSTVGH